MKGLDSSAFTVKQVFYTSKDGTKVPMFVMHKSSLPLDGNNPTLLNGYGGFNIADTPYFSVSRLMVLQHMNGVVAVANLRGGRSGTSFNWAFFNRYAHVLRSIFFTLSY